MYYNELIKITDEKNVLRNEPLSKHCTFKIGGECEYLVFPESEKELTDILKFSKENEIPLNIIGNGSNVLFSDDFHKGIIIKTTRLDGICVKENEITAFCGAKLSAVCNTALKNSLSGMEELNGIPGTIGGAVYMNAGAYGGEIKDVCVETTYIDGDFSLKTIKNGEHNFSYRKSFFTNKNYVILKSKFALKKGDEREIKAKMQDFVQRRNEKQPLNFPNAGSTFKRPEGYFAGKLIEDCGLKGFCVGDACVSEKHSGFVVNRGNASAEDVTKLIKHVRKNVKDKFNVDLETEIKFI